MKKKVYIMPQTTTFHVGITKLMEDSPFIIDPDRDENPGTIIRSRRHYLWEDDDEDF